ncbi:hypothetical protein [Xanthomarina gelatinilytica]|uniref:hypothetical protein n=1 Tax=Xanthomarina gelatinilytica TaxID=1137281 RepID=UPI003AA86A35|tara:strand:+ start:431 stop:685 length:255 start_codon:yes stop_codon:yes gene_type:complete
MSTYQSILLLEKLPYFNLLLQRGIIPITWMDYKVIYEFYLDQVEILIRDGFSVPKANRTANTITADEYNISESGVYKIIQKMRL